MSLFHKLNGQSSKVDSLKSILSNSKNDTLSVKLLNEISFEYWDINPGEGLINGRKALALAEKLNLKSEIAEAYSNIGRSYRRMTILTKALEYSFKSLKLYEDLNDQHGIASNLVNIGNTYRVQKDYGQALDYLTRALKINIDLKDEIWMARNLNSIGNVYKDIGDYQKTIEYYSRSLAVAQKINNTDRIAAATTNLGSVYGLLKEYDKALENDFKALKIYKILGKTVGSSECFINIAKVNLDIHREKKQSSNFRNTSITTFSNLQLAKLYTDSALWQDKQSGHLEGQLWDYKILFDVYSEMRDHQNALNAYQIYVTIKDSISNEESNRRIAQIEKNNEEDIKQKEIEIQKLQLQAAEKERIYFILGLIFLGGMGGLIAKSLVTTRKQKKLIEEKNIETLAQKKIIEEKNKDITDSITYAQRIQQAKLPLESEIYLNLTNSFVLYKPKDIVSGDFYYFQKKENLIFLAAADCTGHGVPGALMSMIGSDKLEEAVIVSNNTSTILKHLNRAIKNSLRQSESDESTRDGMDIAFCAIDLSTKTVNFSGAFRPLWIIKKGGAELIEIPATKKAIAGLTPDDQEFESHSLNMDHGDTMYISTDGYADQFSGKTGRKLMTKKFKELLISIQDKTMIQQKKHLLEFHEAWREGIEQVDDILIIGIRF